MALVIRDYIHVNDIAQGHIIVLKAFEKENEKFFESLCPHKLSFGYFTFIIFY